ncbi:MAG: GTP-binding protein [Rubrivivax sp.]
MHTLPLVVVGGWLGAGKTTLVNHLLRHAGGRRIAVLVNDFGDVGIDADLIASSADASAGVLSLAGGCLCCSFGDDLVGTLAGLARREPPPDLALIELSGVALPDAVLRTARLCPAVQVVGTLVLADAGAVRRQAADRYVSDTVQQQLASADWLLLNKADLVGADEARATLDWLAAQAPRARVWAGQADQVAPELVLGWPDNASPEPAPHDAAQAFGGRPIGAAGRASAIFESVTVELPPGVDLQALGAALADAGSGVLRAKALAADAQGQGRLLQVAGGRWAVTPVAAPSSGRLVMIGLRGRWDPQALRGRVGQP